MDVSRFWALIDEARELAEGSDATERAASQAEHLTQLLKQRSAAEIETFERRFHELMNQSYRWDLWGAAYVIHGGCSDDAFDYFRAWLIGQGREVFERALKEPESLLELARQEPDPTSVELEAEPLMYAAADAYIARTAEDLDVPLPQRPDEPRGKAWEENELPKLFPKLWAHFEGA
ncbi:MAG: DUF4240 domain-containing protein [Planctomycetes bacterium]|nr:DUF4240 domain-containing protein [Planctomycetota bacterium]